MGHCLAIANQKGGVGKTTTCINLAASLVMLDRSVLVVDCDPQGNTTMGSGVNKNQLEFTITDCLLDDLDVYTVLLSTQAGYDLLPANSDLTAAEIGLLQKSRREHRLLQALSRIRTNYDFVMIDCPPALNMLTLNALVAANSVLIPLQCEYYALEGLVGLLQTIEQIQKSVNKQLTIEGLLRTMYDTRNKLTHEVTQTLIERFPKALYDTVIPRNVSLAEAPSHGLPACLYDKSSSGGKAYLALANEFLDRRKQALCGESTEITV